MKKYFYRLASYTAIAASLLLNTANAQVIFTVAGNGNSGYTGDGHTADSAELNNPYAVAVDKMGNIFIADNSNNAIRVVSKSTGIITTIAGGNSVGNYSGDNGPATAAKFNSPAGVALDDSNNIYITDYNNNAIRKITRTTGIINTIAGGNSTGGYGGDNGQATSALVSLNGPTGIAVDAAGNIFFSDANNYIVREINKATGIITTVAGTPQTSTYSGDSAIATTLTFSNPEGVAVDKAGNLYVADNGLYCVWKISGQTDSMTVFAGTTYTDGQSAPPALATYVSLEGPWGVAVDTLGNVYVSDEYNNSVDVINKNDTLSILSGIGGSGEDVSYNGDNIMANEAFLSYPLGVAVDDSANIYVADQYNQRMRKIRFNGPNIISQPSFYTNACYGAPLAIGIVVSGTGATYQWMIDTTGTWQNLSNGGNYSGVNTDTLRIGIVNTYSAYTFKCVLNSGYLNSDSTTLTVNTPVTFTMYSDAESDSICPLNGTQLNINVYGDWTSVLWSDGSTSQSDYVYPAVSTTYYATITDNNGCKSVDSLDLLVNVRNIKANVLPSTTVCKGSTVTLYGTNATNYSWNALNINYLPNPYTFKADTSIRYYVSGTENTSGCQDTNSIYIRVVNSPTVVAITSQDSICPGGSVILNGRGASTYSWSNGVSNNVSFSPTASAIYFVTGTDSNGCTGNASIPVIVNPLPAVGASASNNLVCAGNSVTLTGDGALTYSWSSGVSNNISFVPINSNTYTVTGTDFHGCTNTASVAVTVNPKPVISATAFPSAALCQGSSLALFGSGGASYAWSGGVNNGVSFTPASSITYTLTGIDDNGCTNTDSIKVTVHNKVVPTLTSLNTSCGLKNGSAAVVASNGTPPYTYTWSTTPVIYTAAVDSLAAGTYVVSVSDSANCASTVAVSIAASTAPILSVSATNSNCGTVGTGSASVVVTGGTTPYHYLWNNGDTLPTDFNLKAATYIITVTDVNGCSTFAPAIVSNNNGPVIATTSLVNVTCFGAATGAISVSVSGGTAPYTYNWSNGATTASIGSLYQGPYQLTIMDADSCTSVKTFTINQPKNTISVAASSLRANCGVADGAATVAVSGGTSPYAYSWNNAVSTAKDSDLAAGVYSVIITDGNGCIDSAHVSVSDKNGPALKLTLTSNATCAAGGLLSVAATGINMPFTYAWSNGSSATSIANIPAGNYDVTVTDAHGCVSSADTSVVELAPPAKPLCMVTVDPISNKHNIIVWNKTNATQIASYNVYKESTTAGVYFKIASVPATDSTQFIDTLSDPTVRSWRYELSQVDSCGNESQLSPDQKTMHLTVNQGLGNNINLIWDNYEGLNFSTYYIYKDTINTSFTVIDSIPNNIFTYTDQHYWKTSKPLLYRIGVINPNGCDPAARTLAINYNATKSNTGNITFNPNTVSVNAINTPITDVQVFPNPSTGLVTFALQLPAKEQDLTLSIINTLGQVVLTTQYNGIAGAVSKTIDLATLAKGVYFAKIYNNNSTLYRKIVLQ